MKLYNELADWFHLLTAPDEYEEEAAAYRDLLLASGARPLKSVLELGSGGGNNASHLKQHFDLTLVELSTGMIEISQRLNPECEHLQGDMRTVRLGRAFDGVFIHDAVCYMTTAEDLRLAMETAFVHCRPGGVLLVCPDFTTESFASQTEHGGHDGEDRSLRYLAWTWDPEPSDTTYVVDYAYLLREGDTTRLVHDRHVEGLFSRAVWLETLRSVGLTADVKLYDHSDVERPIEIFIGRRATT